jgi:hypothetical protein
LKAGFYEPKLTSEVREKMAKEKASLRAGWLRTEVRTASTVVRQWDSSVSGHSRVIRAESTKQSPKGAQAATSAGKPKK